MSRNNERDVFLKYLADIYMQNPDFPIFSGTIYHELFTFDFKNKKCSKINDDSLVGVQVALNNKFKFNNMVNTFNSRDGYFWVIENRNGMNDQEFISRLYNSIKLYISTSIDNIYKVSELLFNFMINEGIVSQCKIAKCMRNDALVCRVSSYDDAIKVSNYLNGLNYIVSYKPNPFLITNGKVGYAIEGRLSYNSALSKLLEQYLYNKRDVNKLDEVSSSDFNCFVVSQMEMLEKSQEKSFMNLYGITDDDKYRDFIRICTMISKNLDNTLDLEDLSQDIDVTDTNIENSVREYSTNDEEKILYVINSLTNYYSVDDVHRIIMKFIQTGDYRLFTRRDDIRTIVSDNFSSDDVRNIISSLGYKAFVAASKVTYEKYGEEQLYMAINKLFNNDGINGFTNDKGVRSRLGLVIPKELLVEMLMDKVQNSGKGISGLILADMIIEEIGNIKHAGLRR